MAGQTKPKALFISACSGVVLSAAVHVASAAGLKADARTVMPLLLVMLAAAMAVFVPCALSYSRMLKGSGFVDTWRALLGNMHWWARAMLAASLVFPAVFALVTTRELSNAGVDFDIDGLMVRGLSSISFVFFAASTAFLDARARIDADSEADSEAETADEPPGS
jgi:hypothetical protein